MDEHNKNNLIVNIKLVIISIYIYFITNLIKYFFEESSLIYVNLIY